MVKRPTLAHGDPDDYERLDLRVRRIGQEGTELDLDVAPGSLVFAVPIEVAEVIHEALGMFRVQDLIGRPELRSGDVADFYAELTDLLVEMEGDDECESDKS